MKQQKPDILFSNFDYFGLAGDLAIECSSIEEYKTNDKIVRMEPYLNKLYAAVMDNGEKSLESLGDETGVTMLVDNGDAGLITYNIDTNVYNHYLEQVVKKENCTRVYTESYTYDDGLESYETTSSISVLLGKHECQYITKQKSDQQGLTTQYVLQYQDQQCLLDEEGQPMIPDASIIIYLEKYRWKLINYCEELGIDYEDDMTIPQLVHMIESAMPITLVDKIKTDIETMMTGIISLRYGDTITQMYSRSIAESFGQNIEKYFETISMDNIIAEQQRNQQTEYTIDWDEELLDMLCQDVEEENKSDDEDLVDFMLDTI